MIQTLSDFCNICVSVRWTPCQFFNFGRISSGVAVILQSRSLYASAAFSAHHLNRHTDPVHSALLTGLKSWCLPLADHCAANLQITSSCVLRPKAAFGYLSNCYKWVDCHHPDRDLKLANASECNWWLWRLENSMAQSDNVGWAILQLLHHRLTMLLLVFAALFCCTIGLFPEFCFYGIQFLNQH